MKNDNDILVTGGCGQLGCFVVQQLINNGFKPIILDLVLPNAYVSNLVKTGVAEFYRCNLLNEAEISAMVDKIGQIKSVVHLASLIDGSTDIIESAIGSVKLNVLGTVNLLSILPEIKHFVYASSMMIYGIPEYSPINEDHPTQPINIYGASKFSTEKFIQVYSLQKKVDVTILRFSSLYGSGEYSDGNKKRVIPMFLAKIKNNEPLIVFPDDDKEVRDYLHLKDAARAVILSLKRRASGVFNIGSGKGISIKELTETMIVLSRKDIRTIEGKKRLFRPANYTLDVSKAKDLLGFTAQIAFKDGLKEELEFDA